MILLQTLNFLSELGSRITFCCPVRWKNFQRNILNCYELFIPRNIKLDESMTQSFFYNFCKELLLKKRLPAFPQKPSALDSNHTIVK